MIEQGLPTEQVEDKSALPEPIVVGPGLRIYSKRSIEDTNDDIKSLQEQFPEMFKDKSGITICINREWLIKQIQPNEGEQLLFEISTGINRSSNEQGRSLPHPKPSKSPNSRYKTRVDVIKEINTINIANIEENEIKISPSYIKDQFHIGDFFRIKSINDDLKSKYPEKFKTFFISGKHSEVCTDKKWYLEKLAEQDIFMKTKPEYIEESDIPLIYNRFKGIVSIPRNEFDILMSELSKDYPDEIKSKRANNGKEIFVCTNEGWFYQKLEERGVKLVRSNLSQDDFHVSEINIRRYFKGGDEIRKRIRAEIKEIVNNNPDKFEFKKSRMFGVLVCKDVEWFIRELTDGYGEKLRRKYIQKK